MRIIGIFFLCVFAIFIFTACGGNFQYEPEQPAPPPVVQNPVSVTPETPEPVNTEPEMPEPEVPDAPEAPETLETPEAPAPPAPAAQTATFPFPFSAEDLHGNAVTEEALGSHDVFFVYFWTTWCPSCVRAIPGLAELSREFEERVGFLSLLGDFDTAAASAATIKADAGADFLTVSANHPDFNDLMPLLRSGFVPTSIIVDANGNVIGEQIVGGSMQAFRAAILDALGGR